MSEEINVTVNFPVGNKAGLEESKRYVGTLGDVRKELDKVASSNKKIDGREFAAANARVEKLAFSIDEAKRKTNEARRAMEGVREGTAEWRKLQSNILDSEEALTRFNAEAGKIPDRLGAPSGDGMETVGRGDTALASIGGLASGLGAGGLGEIAMIGSDILGAVEAVSLFSGATTAAGTASGAAATGGIAAMVTSLAPFLAIGLAVGAGVTALTAIFNANARAAEEEVRVRTRQRDLEVEYAELIRSGSSEAIKEQITANEEFIDASNRARDAAIESAVAGTAWGDQLRTVIGHALGDPTIYNASGEQALKLNEELRDTTEETANLEKALEKVEERERNISNIEGLQRTAELEAERAVLLRDVLPEAVEQNVFALRAQIEANGELISDLEAASDGSEEYTTAISEAKAQQDELNESLGFYTTVAADAARVNQSRADAEERAEEQAEEIKKAAENDERVLERSVQAHESYTKSLAQLDKAYEKSIKNRAKADLEARKKFAQAETKATEQYNKSVIAQQQGSQKKIIDLQKRADSDIAKIQAGAAKIDVEARKNSADAQRKFNKETAKIDAQRRREALWAEEDHKDSLLDAVLTRNVDAFIAEQKSYGRDKQRRTEEDSAADQERSAALQDELAGIKERRAAQQSSNAQQIADIRARVVEEIATERQANQEKLAEMRANAEESKAERAQAFAEQQAARAEQAAEARANYIEQRTERKTAFMEQLSALQNELSTETSAKSRAYQQQLGALNSFTGSAGSAFSSLLRQGQQMARSASGGTTINNRNTTVNAPSIFQSASNAATNAMQYANSIQRRMLALDRRI